jgi:hypothetical protein
MTIKLVIIHQPEKIDDSSCDSQDTVKDMEVRKSECLLSTRVFISHIDAARFYILPRKFARGNLPRSGFAETQSFEAQVVPNKPFARVRPPNPHV